MIIISDCFNEKIDEGALKIAVTLAGKIKEKDPSSILIAYGKRQGTSDLHFDLNRFFLDPGFLSILRKSNEKVLYIPFASNTLASMFRLLVLSIVSKYKVNVLFVLKHPMGKLPASLLKAGGARVYVISDDSRMYYEGFGLKTVARLRLGVDTKAFHPVSIKEKTALRNKYGIRQDVKVILHVGHMSSGRNVEKLLDVRSDHQVLLVISSATEEDRALRNKLEARGNIRIIDEYVPSIQELYQLSDIYLFPVTEMENCIDMPLSVLEAGACGIPVITTAYEGAKELAGSPGFWLIEDLSKEKLNDCIDKVLAQVNFHDHSFIEGYDWDVAADRLIRDNTEV